MKDRIPLYPGRVTLTPVSGQANTFDLVRADQPTQEGTPLSKATFLKDATASLFGLGADAVPDDVLNKLSKSTLTEKNAKYSETTTIGGVAVGSTIKISVGGMSEDFIVIHQGKPGHLYDNSCNGTWLLMKEPYGRRQWNNSYTNDYANSTIHRYLNSTFLNLFESNIKSQIKQVKIPYRPGSGTSTTCNTGANGLSSKIFLLSMDEVGVNSVENQPRNEGSKLNYFEYGMETSAKNKRIAYSNGIATEWWLRSPFCFSSSNAFRVYSDGVTNSNGCTDAHGIRPAFVLPSTFEVYTYSDGNFYTEQEYDTKITDVLGNLIAIPAGQIEGGVKIATGSYTGTGTYGPSNPNSLTFDFEPKLVAIHDGSINLFSPYTLLWFYGATMMVGQDSSYTKSEISVSGNTFSFVGNSALAQQNVSGNTYHYIAIG